MSDTGDVSAVPGAVLLQIAYEGIKAEYNRIDNLLKLARPDSKPHPLEPYAVTIHKKFAGPKDKALEQLDTMQWHLQRATLPFM